MYNMKYEKKSTRRMRREMFVIVCSAIIFLFAYSLFPKIKYAGHKIATNRASIHVGEVTPKTNLLFPPKAIINHDVPFYPQAPDGDWRLPWQETCEEASITLAYFYATGESLSKELFTEILLDLVQWQEIHLGQYEHTNVGDTTKMLDEYFEFTNYEVVDNPSAKDLKTYLDQGSVIVAPFAGRELGNPYFARPGPVYHMMVIKGYDEYGNFIVNDVGTAIGKNFLYQEKTIIDSMHEWHDTDIRQGGKKIIVIKKDLG